MAERCLCASVALGDVSSEVGRGERFGLSGPAGTGKATPVIAP
jgi:ABC-type dipeptide/oligopeptide/nickel transport system ATPase subunit